MIEKAFKLKLRGKARVFIDWANVYGWKKSLKAEVNPRKLYRHCKSYKETKLISLYYGTDTHEKSKLFLQNVKRIGF